MNLRANLGQSYHLGQETGAIRSQDTPGQGIPVSLRGHRICLSLHLCLSLGLCSILSLCWLASATSWHLSPSKSHCYGFGLTWPRLDLMARFQLLVTLMEFLSSNSWQRHSVWSSSLSLHYVLSSIPGGIGKLLGWHLLSLVNMPGLVGHDGLGACCVVQCMDTWVTGVVGVGSSEEAVLLQPYWG